MQGAHDTADALVDGPIQFEPVMMKDRVAEVIRNYILSGKLRPGERLVELQLAKQFRVGTTSVREALFELQREGFVMRVAGKGVFATELTAEDFQEIYSIRFELERVAVALLANRATPEQSDELRARIAGMREAASAGDLRRFTEIDLAFHRSLWGLSGNKHLFRCLDAMVAPMFAYYLMRGTQETSESLNHSADLHAGVVEAIVARDPAEAGRRMQGMLKIFCKEDMTTLSNQPKQAG